jgi:hypothetical protein
MSFGEAFVYNKILGFALPLTNNNTSASPPNFAMLLETLKDAYDGVNSPFEPCTPYPTLVNDKNSLPA